MRHPKTDAMELQLEALLRSAAAFEPELDAPFDLVDRAMQRATRNIAVVRIRRPIVTLLWGSAAGAAAASAAAAILMTSPPPRSADPVQTVEAGIGAKSAGYRVTAKPETEQVEPPRRSVRVRSLTTAARFTPEPPALKAAWQTEEIERNVEQVVRPAVRVQLDEQGQAVDLQTGLLETLTVSEQQAACGPSEDEETGDEFDDSSGESRAKEADLPSKED